MCWLRASIQLSPPAFSALNPRSGSCKRLELEEWLSPNEAEVGKAVSLWPRCLFVISRKSEFLLLVFLCVTFHAELTVFITSILCVNDWLYGGVGGVILPYKFPVGVQLSCF